MNYIQQAYKGKNDWYHWLFTLVIVFFGWQVLGVLPLVMAAFSKSENITQFTEFAQENFIRIRLAFY